MERCKDSVCPESEVELELEFKALNNGHLNFQLIPWAKLTQTCPTVVISRQHLPHLMPAFPKDSMQSFCLVQVILVRAGFLPHTICQLTGWRWVWLPTKLLSAAAFTRSWCLVLSWILTCGQFRGLFIQDCTPGRRYCLSQTVYLVSDHMT